MFVKHSAVQVADISDQVGLSAVQVYPLASSGALISRSCAEQVSVARLWPYRANGLLRKEVSEFFFLVEFLRRINARSS